MSNPLNKRFRRKPSGLARSAGHYKPHKEQKQKFSVIIWIKVFTNDYMDFHRLILWRSAKFVEVIYLPRKTGDYLYDFFIKW